MDKITLKAKNAADKRKMKLRALFSKSGMTITAFANKHDISQQRMSVLLGRTQV